MSDRLARKVLLVGWDTADWNIISPMLDAGALPRLASLVERGTMGRLTATAPVHSPSLWTSIATGRRAYGHGILTAEEPDPDTGGTRPVSSRSRMCKAIWNILTQAGLRAHVVNWWASHPAEPIGGACVSDRFARVVGPADQPWPLRPGTIHPPRLEERLAELRVHPADLSAPHLLPFVPEGTRIDQKIDRRLEILATHVAATASVHAAATLLLEHEPCDFLAVRYGAFDPLSLHFLTFRAPRPAHVSEADFAIYKDVIDGVYRFHDMMLGRLLDLAGPETTVILVADHGFSVDHLRTPEFDPTRPATVVSGHRPHGFFVMAGPRVRRDQLTHGASVLDVAPTVLTLLGLAMGADFEGRPLLEALDDVAVPARIPSWESVPGDAGQHPRDTGEDDAEVAGVIEQLAALGYVEVSEEDSKRWGRLTRERGFNLAIAHMAANRMADAVPLLEGLYAKDPDDIIPALHLAHAYLLLGRRDDSRTIIDDVLARRPDHPSVDLARGRLELAEGRPDVAIAALLNAEANKAKRPGLELFLGQCYIRLRRGADAERAYRAVIARDENFASGHHGLAVSLILQGRYQEAAEAALTAIGLHYHLPRAHRALGFALTRLGEVDRAVGALETCLAIDPSDLAAKRLLDRLLAQRTKRAAPGMRA